jgi:hypothetical protein
MSTFYIGQDSSLTEILGNDNPRYFYAIRRDDEGLVYFAKVDQITSLGSITINQSGLADEIGRAHV